MTEPATEPVRIWHLLTHMGLVVMDGFLRVHPVDAQVPCRRFRVGQPVLALDLDAVL